MNAVMVYITAGGVDEARNLAQTIVKERLAACANIIPRIESVYWWDGKVCTGDEAVVIAKTTRDQVDDLIALVKEVHSYEVPAVVVLNIEKGLPAYLEWLVGEVRQ